MPKSASRKEEPVFRVIDLTKRLNGDSIAYPGDQPVLAIDRIDVGDPTCLVSKLTHLDLHGGTHIDAPLHFVPGGADVAALTLQLLPAVLVETSRHPIGLEGLPDRVRGCAVLFSTGWERRKDTPGFFSGYPHLTTGAAQAVVDGGAALVGLDTPSADPVEEPYDFPVHRTLLRAGVPIVEGLCNLPLLRRADGEIWFGCFPLRIEGVEASPVRAVAFTTWDTARDTDASIVDARHSDHPEIAR
jgi:arylformamidase